jgi:predicted dehydrogenase
MGSAPDKDSSDNAPNPDTKPRAASERRKSTDITNYDHIEKKVGIVIVGTGQRMCALLRYLLGAHGGLVQVLAICDESEAAMKEAVERLWIYPQLKDVPRFTDYKEVLKMESVEWVLIGSKNYLHRDHCIESFKAGKNVFCEKPLAITIEQCDEIRKVQQETGKLFATGFVLRHAPFYQKIYELVHSGELGKIVSVEANEMLVPAHGAYIMRNWRRFREQSGPHLLEKCCHDLDIMNWIIGGLPVRVASFGGLNVFVPENKPPVDDDVLLYNAWGSYEKVDAFESEKDIEDNQVVILEYSNNVRATFHTNANSAFSQRRIVICGVKGTIEADLIQGKIKFQKIGYRQAVQEFDMGAKDMHGGADHIIVADLAKSIETGCKPRATGEEGFLSALVCLSIDQAFREGSVVNLRPLWERFNVPL